MHKCSPQPPLINAVAVRIVIVNLIKLFAHLIYVLQVQKVFSQSAVFSSLTPGSLYHFAVRTEKESFIDSSPVTINITAGKHTHTHTCSSTSLSFIPNMRCFVIWQLLPQWRSLLSIKPHHPYALVGLQPGDC